MKCTGAGDLNEVDFRPENKHLKVFTDQEEYMLVKYIKTSANIHYGLTADSARRLAYEFASQNNKVMKPNWERDKMAGEDWLYQFRKRLICHYELLSKHPLIVALVSTKQMLKCFLKIL